MSSYLCGMRISRGTKASNLLSLAKEPCLTHLLDALTQEFGQFVIDFLSLPLIL